MTDILQPAVPQSPRPAPEPTLDIGFVVSKTFETLFKHIGHFVVFSLILIVGFILLMVVCVGVGYAMGGEDFLDNLDYLEWSNAMTVVTILFVIGFMLLYSHFMASITTSALMSLKGQKPNLSVSFSRASRRCLPVAVTLFLLYVALTLGFLLLIIPMFILLVFFAVVMPASVEEDITIIDAFSRSVALTEGYRGTIFGLGVVFFFINLGIGIVSTGIGMILAMNLPAVYFVWDIAVNVFSALLSVVAYAVLYFELRRLKEGMGAASQADVFA